MDEPVDAKEGTDASATLDVDAMAAIAETIPDVAVE